MDDDGVPPAGRLAAALQRAGFWPLLERLRHGRSRHRLRIVIKPELGGFAAGSPAITDPALVEALLDLLHDAGFTDAVVVGAADSSALWAGNRDLLSLSDLLGYRFATPKGRGYDIVDLADEIDDAAFPAASALHGCGLSRLWRDADLRIVFGTCRTDEALGCSLCLDTLIGVLPLVDKDLHYRRRRHPGDVAAALLAAAPVGFGLIDAIVGAHGEAGRRAPEPIATGTIIAATDLVLADHAGATKMGLDPEVSPLFARVLRTHPLPRRYIIAGSLRPFAGWRNVPPATLHATAQRGQAEMLDRLVEPWLQRLDTELFPLKHPLDAGVNAKLAELAGQPGMAPLLALAGALIGGVGEAVTAYRTLFDKDALRRQALPLGFDPAAIAGDPFADLVAEMQRLEPLAAAAPEVSPELAWQECDGAIVFRYRRTLPIPHAAFVRRVDIARTIQFMNDYLGGIVIVLARDAAGRPVRQAERNLYLPQPNYLVLYQGKPIDVSKLEVVEYGAGRHRLYWKTMLSENGSATYDDGIATFERAGEGTRVTITGRQRFTLPPFWQAIDLDLVPALKARLVTHAYQTFFDRTLANFEALVEGRDIRIGRPVDEPAPPPIEQFMPLVEWLGEALLPLLQGMGRSPPAPGGERDADGFVHITPAQQAAPDAEGLGAGIARFVEDFIRAGQRDLNLSRPAR
ncbi:MAG: DUF362 domain-containing protein [Acetobacteraceae bacterium]